MHIVQLDKPLGILEFKNLPFIPKRIYWLSDPETGQIRGNHAHKSLRQFIWAVKGSVEIVLSDGKNFITESICYESQGILLEPGLWRTLKNFSKDSVIVILADRDYIESDYIRNWNEFLEWIKPNA